MEPVGLQAPPEVAAVELTTIWPPITVFPVPLGVSVTFWLLPPAAKVSAPVPVMEPVVVPVPPLPTGKVPETSAVKLAADLVAKEPRPETWVLAIAILAQLITSPTEL